MTGRPESEREFLPTATPHSSAHKPGTLEPGLELGGYEILGALGAGGMGEVYRARDLKLRRDVAIKVLPEALARDSDRLARFQREAKILASLNHPGIAAIYDVARTGDFQFLVLELVEGETLADRLRRGPIPLADARFIAQQIAEALEAAHEKGIVHRDLKPANVKITAQGKVKVLDFGLAKAVPQVLDNPSDSPTLTVTTSAVIMGTPAYMPPEQAAGKDADSTTDVWAFGCLLFEMLAGRRPFAGETANEVLANVLNAAPEWRHLPAGTPKAVLRVLRRCLQKDRRERTRHIADVRFDLSEADEADATESVAVRRLTKHERALWMSAIVLVSAVTVGVLVWRAQPAAEEMRVEISTPPTREPAAVVISPDGRSLAFVATVDGKSSLWIRSLDSDSARPLPGTEGAGCIFWRPDSRFVGFGAESGIKSIDLKSGYVRSMRGGGFCGTWNSKGVILYGGIGISRTAEDGSAPEAVTTLETGHARHLLPRFLPDDRHFLFYAEGTPDTRGIYIGQIDGPGIRRLRDADSSAVFALKYVFFVSQGRLFAQEFDLERLELSGEPFPVADGVSVAAGAQAALSASVEGRIAIRKSIVSPQRQLIVFDQQGVEVKRIGNADSSRMVLPSVSPDERKVAVNRVENQNNDIFEVDMATGQQVRLTLDPGNDSNPVYSPDGKLLVYETRFGVVVQPVNAAPGTQQSPLRDARHVLQWSKGYLLDSVTDSKKRSGLRALPMAGAQRSGEPVLIVQTDADERNGQFSPNEKWVAYQSDETGRPEIYVAAFPPRGDRPDLISTKGGSLPRWSDDGAQLFYLGPEDEMMAVAIKTSPDGRQIEAGAPRKLFQTHIVPSSLGVLRQQYVVLKNGHFLINSELESIPSPITLILNWRGKSPASRSE